MSEKNKSIGMAFYSALAYIIPLIGMFFSYKVYDDVLGRSMSGVYIFATSFSTTLTFLGFGVSNAVTKMIAERSDIKYQSDIIDSGIIFYFLVGVLSVVGIVFYIDRLVSGLGLMDGQKNIAMVSLIWGALALPVALVNEVLGAALKGQLKYKEVVFCRLVLSVGSFVLSPILVKFFSMGVIGLSVVNLLSYVSCVVAALIFLSKTRGGILFSKNKNNIKNIYFLTKKLINTGWAIALVGILAFIYFQGQRYIVAMELGAASVAAYVYAYSVSSRVHGLISASTEVVFPIAANKSASKEEIINLYYKSLSGGAVMAAIMCGVLYFMAEIIVKVWLGRDDSDVSGLIKIFSVAYFALSLSPASYHIFNAIGLSRFNLIAVFLRATVNGLALIFFWKNNMLSLENMAICFAFAALSIDGILWPLFLGFMFKNKLFANNLS